ELWGALLYGGRLVVVPYWVSRSPEAFYELICTHQVTVLNQTPSAFYQFMRAEMQDAVGRKHTLRLIIFGGESLEFARLRPWFERHGDQSPLLVNMYGITETTVHVTYRPLKLADVGIAKGSLIGGPIPDLRVYILDQHLELMPSGVTGEMYVGGAGVTSGYLNRPELTAERYLPDPYSFLPGARMYRTGDLARTVYSGELEYLGRIDQQVKIRGFRIELEEVEGVMTSHPSVRDSAVIASDDAAAEKRIVAYVVLNQHQKATPEQPDAKLSDEQITQWE